MEERLCFVARLQDGEAMTDLCREFGISRKTGYKIFERYQAHGLVALTDRIPLLLLPGVICKGWRQSVRRFNGNLGVAALKCRLDRLGEALLVEFVSP
jgi:hypothetical protein